jgi:GT2 family glycosyltransferase
LREFLAVLAQLDYPASCLQVVLVDDGSDQPLEECVKPFREALDIVLLRQQNQGPAAARNHGVAHASGEFIAFTDDDCRPRPDWLKLLMMQLQETPACLVGGRTRNALQDSVCDAASQLITDVVYARYNADLQNAQFFSNNNMALSRALFLQAGGLREDFRTAEDREFCDRWRHQGRRMVHVPEAVMDHAHGLSLAGYCRQHFNYGRGAASFHRLALARGSGQLQDDLRFHAQGLGWLRAPFTHASGWRSAQLLALMLLWQGVNALGMARELVSGSRPRP